MSPSPETGASLNAARRARDLDRLADRPDVDLLVAGGGVTGAGIALDAASRGLRVVLAEKHDLAFGTSRWSSKLVHGGLRYLAAGQVGIARESARERHILLSRTAPHLVRALPMLLPLHPQTGALQAAFTRTGLLLGDVLRLSAGTPGARLPPSRRVSRARALELAPQLRPDGLRGGQLSYDGQLVDDARLVVALARTAAARGATVLTRCAVEEADGGGALLRDRLSGAALRVRARAVVNATGVWAAGLAPDVRLRPSRGSHLVLPGRLFPGLRAALTLPVPGHRARFALVLPQLDGGVYVGLTDEPVAGPVPDVPEPTEDDIAFLLETVGRALRTPPGRADVAGAFAGLRPLLDTGPGASADLSRRHAVLTSPEGVVTVVGGKLTTYRRMAQDAVDTAVARARLRAGPCRTRALPLVGAASPAELRRIRAPRRLVARYGAEAPAVLAEARGRPCLLEPLAAGVTGAELRWAVRHEGALEAADLLERRTRAALVAEDAAALDAAAREALAEGARAEAAGRSRRPPRGAG
ncbi:glycerol-3-phosphate dehydrogenase/oxidase [Streptomonospora nanhaiensis]|uniref:glycerol-3-phosphate dehydrogenase/oxidase n=1 Tax=Streptomonospora nanhaiensis TaxID=1323731 RepID=UPI001C3839D5|nr:glycerol-3-phosphate dehydrogenase/oxidase [Streptomonospora nanhaiensis]MBV2366480.1 glycerol-3-phosphate dehydrogenase/oxidase [Streptomonospora nanhaiensis]MBX9391403.1 glycerol-3-phosphate dehydrogenase/oxidase [Streptomonospora nanhaiensis]